jgi:hypothetical protein
VSARLKRDGEQRGCGSAGIRAGTALIAVLAKHCLCSFDYAAICVHVWMPRRAYMRACEQRHASKAKGDRTLKRCLMPKCSSAKSQSDLGRPVTTAMGYLAASFSRTCVCVCAAKNGMSATPPALIPAEPQPLWP